MESQNDKLWFQLSQRTISDRYWKMGTGEITLIKWRFPVYNAHNSMRFKIFEYNNFQGNRKYVFKTS